MNVNKSEVIVFERSKCEIVDFDRPDRVRVECTKELDVRLNGEKNGRGA